MKKYLTIVLLIILVKVGNSQNFIWNLTSKVDHSTFCHYIGQINGNHFLVVSKFTIKNDFPENTKSGIQYTRNNLIQLLRFDEKFNLIDAKPLALSGKLDELFKTFIVKDKMLFIYSGIVDEGTYKLFCDEVNSEGTLIGVKDIPGCSYSFPERELLVFGGTPMTFYDYNYKEVAKFSTSATVSDLVETSNGDFIALLKDQSVIRIDLKTKKSEVLKLDYKDLSIKNTKMKISGDYLFAVSTYGHEGKWEFEHQGVVLKKIHLPTFKEEKGFESAFTSEILLKITGKKKLDKIVGVEDLMLKNIHLSEDGSVIAIIEPCDITSSNEMSGNSSRTTYSSWYGDFILVKLDSEGKSEQKILSRYSSGMSMYEYLLSNASFYKDKHLYLLYNEGVAPYALHVVKMDINFNIISDTEIKTYKEHGLYFGVRNYSKVGENKYLV